MMDKFPCGKCGSFTEGICAFPNCCGRGRPRPEPATAATVQCIFDEHAKLRSQVEALIGENKLLTREIGAMIKSNDIYSSATTEQIVGNEQTIAKLRAELDALRDKYEAVVAAARCIRHWHDAMSDSSGMVVSAEHVRALWTALENLAP